MQTERRPSRAVWGIVILLAAIGVAVAVRRTVQLLPILLNGYAAPAPATNPVAAQFAALDGLFARYPALTLVHILPGILFMVLGPIQLSAGIRRRNRRLHRVLGRVYVACAAIIGVTALVMSVAMPAIGGALQAAATTIFAIYFLFALFRAFWHIRRREIAAHRAWMIRAFAIGLAVATIRPIVGLFFATSGVSGLAPGQFFGIAFWIGFLLHLLVAELWLRRSAPQAVGALA